MLRKLLFSSLAALVLACSAPGEDSLCTPPNRGCKGDRICVNGTCVAPIVEDVQSGELFTPEIVEETPSCYPHQEKVCKESGVYWKNSCGEWEELYQQCGSGQECQQGTCVLKHWQDMHDGTVRDNITGLLWQKGHSANELSLSSAINYCDNLTLKGKGWTLPSLEQLKTLLLDSSYTLANHPESGCNLDSVFELPCTKFWSSTYGEDNDCSSNQVWVIDYSNLLYQDHSWSCIKPDWIEMYARCVSSETACIPLCRECGDDGCGNSCGECATDKYCLEGTCTPCQNGKEQFCGGNCGECTEPYLCVEGKCSLCNGESSLVKIDSIIKDCHTGLTWKNENSGKYANGYHAEELCTEGWRLPSLDELTALLQTISSEGNPFLFGCCGPHDLKMWTNTYCVTDQGMSGLMGVCCSEQTCYDKMEGPNAGALCVRDE